MAELQQVNKWLEIFNNKIIKSIEIRDYFDEKQITLFFTNNQRLVINTSIDFQPIHTTQLNHIKLPSDISGRTISFSQQD